MNDKRHHKKEGFCNPFIEDEQRSFVDFLRWRIERKLTIHKNRFLPTPLVEEINPCIFEQTQHPQVTWISHSSVLIQYKKITVLTDPVFSKRPSPFPPISAAAIPIGAYQPRWFMNKYHINPEEAVLIHQEVRSSWSFGIHWGTFALTDEPSYEPPIKLASAFDKVKNLCYPFETLALGQTILF